MGTHVNSHRHTHATKLDPFGTHPGKTMKATDGISRLEVWELMIGDFGKPSELRLRGCCGRRLQGMSWEQVWRAGQISPRCSSMGPEECFWQLLQHRVGRRSDVIVQGWWRRRAVRDARKRTRTRIIEFGDAKTQHLVHKATQAKDTLERFWLCGLVPRSWTLQDTKLGFWRQFGSGVLTEACTYIFGDGSGTHSDPRIRRVGWSAVVHGVSNCFGQTLECWKLHSERLMNGLKPTGGWMGTLGEGEPNTLWVGRSLCHAWWQLRAREATQSTSQTTRSS